MNIRKTDSKGRVSVGRDGQVYSLTEHGDGTITLVPVTIPEPPKMRADSLSAVYWTPAALPGQEEDIYIRGALPFGRLERVQWVVGQANALGLPLVMSRGTQSAVIADYAETIAEHEVIKLM